MASDRGTRIASVAKLLADAHRAAGDKAVESVKRDEHEIGREWSKLAVEIQALMKRSVELMSL